MKKGNGPTMTQILIGALSGWKYHERRQRCLATWMADAEAVGIDCVFLLGCPTATQPERIGPHALVCPCPDDYQSLSQRTLWFCRWALGEEEEREQGRKGERERVLSPPFAPAPFLPFSPSSPPPWDYLFKCDDDTYVSIPRLLAYDLAGRDYIGAEWRPGVGYGSGGAGYFLSRRAATIAAEGLIHATGSEDLLVGRILRAAGIEFAIEPRLVPFGSMTHRPRRDNDLITLHGVEAEAFLAAHTDTGRKS